MYSLISESPLLRVSLSPRLRVTNSTTLGQGFGGHDRRGRRQRRSLCRIRKTIFRCQQCGYVSPKWLGRCPDCQSWQGLVEEVAVKKASRGRASPRRVAPLALADIPFEVGRPAPERHRGMGPGARRGAHARVHRFAGGRSRDRQIHPAPAGHGAARSDPPGALCIRRRKPPAAQTARAAPANRGPEPLYLLPRIHWKRCWKSSKRSPRRLSR